MQTSLVSVIVPVYNTSRYLSECLESIIAQSYSNIEIICVNDGSTDNSLEILQKYAAKDSRIKIISQKNQGQSAARNIGLSLCTGDFIIMVDSDDTIDNKLIKICLEHMKKYDVDGVYFNSDRFNEKGDVWNVYTGLPYVPENSEIIDTKTSFFASTWSNAPWGIYNRNIIENHNLRFIEGMTYEDWEFVTHYTLYCKKIYWLNKVLYHYRCNHKSTTMTVSSRFLNMFKSYNIVRQRYIDNNVWDLHKFISIRKILDYSLGTYLNMVINTKLKADYINAIYAVMHQESEADVMNVINDFNEESKKFLQFIYNKNFDKVYRINAPKTFHKIGIHKNYHNLKEAYHNKKYKDMLVHSIKLSFKVITRFHRIFTK